MGGPRLRAGAEVVSKRGIRLRLPTTIGGYPVSYYEECSYLDAEYLIMRDGGVMLVGGSSYAMAVRMRPDKRQELEDKARKAALHGKA